MERVSSGIEGFDKLIEGGFPKSNITLISGTPGTGKSIFCAQILYNNALKGKKCLYLNLEQDEGRLEGQMQDFGWDVEKVKKNLKIVGVESTDRELVEFVLTEIQKMNYDLIVLDSLDSISSTPMDMEELGKMSIDKIQETVLPTTMDAPTIGRMKLKKIFSAIAKSKANAFVTSERVEGAEGISRDTISEFLCDSIILLHYIGVGAVDFRSLQIRKMRRSGHEKGYILFEITKEGVKLTEDPLKTKK